MFKVLFHEKKSIFLTSGFIMALAMVLLFSFTADVFAGYGFGVKRLEWKDKDAVLKIKGFGAGKKKIVKIYDSASGKKLGRTRSKDDGKFKFEIKNLGYAPCEIRVKRFDGLTVVSGYTRRPPKNCGESVEVVLESLIIDVPVTTDENNAVQYMATAVYSDGSSKDVTIDTVWSENSNYVDFRAHGLLHTVEVEEDTSVLISASYFEGGVTAESSTTLTILDVPEYSVGVIEATDKLTGIDAHLSIDSYEGPSTCIKCHEDEARQMLNSVHMQWAGPTPELSNTSGESLGKAKAGINTFCTYAVSSKSACYSCHVRADGNASHEPEVNDVDCLMCHSDSYQRKFVSDPGNTETITDIYGEDKTYTFGLVDSEGNYVTEPDYNKMPQGITMAEVAQSVHLPTRASCLRCHAKAGGGDWTKRGDMGLSSIDPDFNEDVHMSKQGADFTCSVCHAADNHKIGGRGIDLRQTEAPDPKCINCHSDSVHESLVLNRHASGQVSCQVCHIREFGKGGATEMSRDWLEPVWNPAFCSGQGGFVGHEVKVASVKPDYRWFDGTSYVYNVGEKITPNADGTYTMAKANGKAFDKNSKIVPIKDHWTIMPLHESGQIIPPVIMKMFMTGDFDQAVQEGMAEQGMTGDYTLVDANAEMLITHGVDPKSKAATCIECHNGNGASDLMLPFAELGYHTFPASVSNCVLCHEQKSAAWEPMHNDHVRSKGLDCNQCHTSEPIGFVKDRTNLCNDCHDYKEPEKIDELHKHHLKKGYVCGQCHEFS